MGPLPIKELSLAYLGAQGNVKISRIKDSNVPGDVEEIT